VVLAADPLVRATRGLDERVVRVELDRSSVEGCDVAVVCCPQPGMDLSLLAEAPYVFDTRGIVDVTGAERL